jgi:hypothetical protein
MPLIPFPSVPNYPGVPAIPRTAPGSPSINISIAPAQNTSVSQSSSEPLWGIFTSSNAPLWKAEDVGTLSVLSFGFERSMQVSDFPVEANNANQGAAFASFNKVFVPSNPILTLALSGTEAQKMYFLAALDVACQSTALYNVLTPDASYVAPNGACTIERYSYQRTATHGATMLIVEVSLKQVLQVTAALTNVPTGTTGITSPQSPSATSATNGGTVNGNDTPVLSQDSIDAILAGGAR